MFFVAPRYYWRRLDIEHAAPQARLLVRYRHWYELFHFCHSHHSGDVLEAVSQTNDYVVSAIELNTQWQTESTIESNEAYLAKRLDLFHRLLTAPDQKSPELIVLPDTNALLRAPEPVDYRQTLESDAFTFAVVPAVLSELDDLKRARHGQAVGEKAEKAIRILKGFRAQGHVLNGVTVSKTIVVRMIAAEPRMTDLPSWLDPKSKDDRIIATALEIQRTDPFAIVVLATGDINLQNKAEMAFLPCVDL